MHTFKITMYSMIKQYFGTTEKAVRLIEKNCFHQLHREHILKN